MTSLLPSSTGSRHGAQRSGSTNLTIIEFIIVLTIKYNCFINL